MRAIVIDAGAARLELNQPDPLPAEGDVTIRVLRVALSHRETDCLANGFSGVPCADFVGVVESGPSAGKLLGKRVVCGPAIACTRCDMCAAGLAPHCRSRSIIGEQGRDGALADRVAVPARNCVEVPAKVDDDHAVFANAVASALHASRQIAIEGKPYITVLGDGYQGLLTVQVMAKLNASVRLLGRFSEKLALCEKWGIKHRHVDDVGRRADQDVVVDCTGSPDGLSLAMQLVRPRGKVVLRSVPTPDSLRVSGPFDLGPVVTKELEIFGSFAGSARDGLRLIEQREVDVVSLISKRMTLADGPTVLRVQARPECIRVLVSPS